MNVKELRNKYRLTQQELSEATGIPKTRINNWEQGKGKPKREDESVLLKYFDSFSNQNSTPTPSESDHLRHDIARLEELLAVKDENIRLLNLLLEQSKKEKK